MQDACPNPSQWYTLACEMSNSGQLRNLARKLVSWPIHQYCHGSIAFRSLWRSPTRILLRSQTESQVHWSKKGLQNEAYPPSTIISWKQLLTNEPQGLLVADHFLRSEHIRGNDTSLCSCSHPTWFQATLGQTVSCLQCLQYIQHNSLCLIPRWVVWRFQISTKSREPNLSAAVVVTSRPRSTADQPWQCQDVTSHSLGLGDTQIISTFCFWPIQRKTKGGSLFSVLSMWAEFKSCARDTCVCLLTAHHGSGLSEATCERSRQCLFLVDWMPRSITGRKQDFFTFLLSILKLARSPPHCQNNKVERDYLYFSAV